MSIKALLIGVSEYNDNIKYDNLPYCKNDIDLIKRGLIEGLKVSNSNIMCCGNNGKVFSNELKDSLNKFISNIEENDTIIIYFSGHGNLDKNKHTNIVLTDTYIPIDDFLRLNINARNKIFILDCCKSNKISMEINKGCSLNNTITDFVGKGYAFLGASTYWQEAGFDEKYKVSCYSRALYYALVNNAIIRKGKKSLEEIAKCINLFIYNNYKDNNQTPIFKSNIGGTIYFDVENYVPYKVKSYYEKFDNYTIYSVEPTHIVTCKRFGVYVILHNTSTIKDISIISNKIIDLLLYCNIYQNQKSEDYYINQKTNKLYIYFGYSENDIINNNYCYIARWCDETQNMEEFYEKNKNSTIINGIWISSNSYYNSLKKLYENSNLNENEFIIQTKSILSRMTTQSELAINYFRKYINDEIEELDLFNLMKPICETLNNLFMESSNLDIPPKELKDWFQKCENLFCTMHDFSYYYNYLYIDKWNDKSRILCMRMTIKYYQEGLEKLKKYNY